MKKYLIIIISTLFVVSCTDLDEDLVGVREESGLSEQDVVTGGLTTAYNQLRSFTSNNNQFMLQMHSSDEMAGPTRGQDWDDGGLWRALHLHEWNSSHPRINDSWNQLLGGMFASIDALNSNPSPEQEAMATFYLSFYMFNMMDLFGQVPYRPKGTSYVDFPIVLERSQALDTAITKLEAVYDNLSDSKAPNQPNKYAASMLLAKLYLNKKVYTGVSSFEKADMDKVIEHTDFVINSGHYSIQTNYFDAFAPNNTDMGTENIFVSENSADAGGDLHAFYFMTLHYNQNPSGWNGFVALSNLYDRFDDADPRKGGDYQGLTDVSGLKAGFLEGQQKNADGTDIFGRNNPENPLVFTKEFDLRSSTESQGIRVIKYIPDYSNTQRPANDFIVFRLADAYLMKAEAMLRNGEDASTVMEDFRTKRGVNALYTGSTLDDILEERSRELYWEGWRRNDQIRFGTFLDPVQERDAKSDETKLLFPIPAGALSTNPNLVQNPGY